MSVVDKISHWFVPPPLTRLRIGLALTVAVLTDTAQLLLGPLGWVFLDQILDAIAMVLTSALLGFHMLLLPTFVIEMLPLTDLLPTWTGCTFAVVMLRRKTEPPAPPLPTKMAKVASDPTEIPAGVPGEVLENSWSSKPKTPGI